MIWEMQEDKMVRRNSNKRAAVATRKMFLGSRKMFFCGRRSMQGVLVSAGSKSGKNAKNTNKKTVYKKERLAGQRGKLQRGGPGGRSPPGEQEI